MNNFFKKPLDRRPKVWYIIVVREGISKALLLTDATSTNGEETLERKRRLQVALQFKTMDNDYNDIYFFLILGLVSFVVILATGIYIETL